MASYTLPLYVYSQTIQRGRQYQVLVPLEAYAYIQEQLSRKLGRDVDKRDVVEHLEEVVRNYIGKHKSVEDYAHLWELSMSAAIRKIIVGKDTMLLEHWPQPRQSKARLMANRARSDRTVQAGKDRPYRDLMKKCYHRLATPHIRKEIEEFFATRGWGTP